MLFYLEDGFFAIPSLLRKNIFFYSLGLKTQSLTDYTRISRLTLNLTPAENEV